MEASSIATLPASGVPRVTPASLSQLKKLLQGEGLELTDREIVQWRLGCAQHPLNWLQRKKFYNAALLIFLDFFITVVGTVGTAAAGYAGPQYKVGRTPALVAFTSMYFIGQAVGGISFPPYSESFGRKSLYLASMSLFTVFSIPISLTQSISAVYVGRFMTGLLSATPSIVVAGSLEDMFGSKTRLWLVSLWLVVLNLSLVIGPIYATYVTSTLGWRWMFHILTMTAALSVLLLLAASESRATHLLKHRVRAIDRSMGNEPLRTENPDHIPDTRTFAKLIVRPLRLLLTEPIVLMVSTISALAFALVYLFIEVLPDVYGSFGFTPQQSSLAFVALGVGFVCTVFTRIHDHKVASKCAKTGSLMSPEDKLTGFAIAAPAFAIGLWLFAWTIPPKVPQTPWILSMLALAPVGFAINEFDCVLVGYLTDSYSTYSSSAFASLSLLRSALSAVFPLFAHQMYTKLGPNYATTVLAVVATIACSCPLILIRYGERIRRASRFAQHSESLGNDTISEPTETVDAAVVTSRFGRT